MRFIRVVATIIFLGVCPARSPSDCETHWARSWSHLSLSPPHLAQRWAQRKCLINARRRMRCSCEEGHAPLRAEGSPKPGRPLEGTGGFEAPPDKRICPPRGCGCGCGTETWVAQGLGWGGGGTSWPLHLAWASGSCPRAAQPTPPSRLRGGLGSGRWQWAGRWVAGRGRGAQSSPNQSDFFAEVSGGALRAE